MTGQPSQPDEPDRRRPIRLDRAELQRRVVRGTAWTVVNTVVSVPVAFLANLVIARALGVADYGTLALLMATLEVGTQIVSAGVTSGLVQYGASAHAEGDEERVTDLIRKTQGFRILVQIPLLTVLVVAVADVGIAETGLLVAFGIMLPAVLGAGPPTLAVENKTAAAARTALVMTLVIQSAAVAAALLAGTAEAVWGTRLVVAGLVFGLALVPLIPAYRRATLLPRLPRGFPPGFWRFSVAAGAASVLGGLVASRSEIFVLKALSSAEETGVYALAVGIASQAFGPVMAFVGPLIPAAAALLSVDRASASAALLRAIRLSALAAAGLFAVAAPALFFLVPVLYGEAYAPVSPLLVVLLVAVMVQVVFSATNVFVTARRRSGVLLRVTALALAVDLVAAVALVPIAGAWGAVMAYAAGVATMQVLLIMDEATQSGLSKLSLLAAAAPALVGVLVGAATLLAALPLGSGVLGAAVSIPVALVVLVVAFRLLPAMIDRDDLEAVVRGLPTFAGRAVWAFGRLVGKIDRVKAE